jgi:hypothetical protein
LNEKENKELNKDISEIILSHNGKLRCLFNTHDPIFDVSGERSVPTEDEKVKMVEA